MARPTRNVIASGEAAWDIEADSNFALITETPFPVCLAADTTALQALAPAANYDACLALVGTSSAARLYISNGTAWVLYDAKAAYLANSAAVDVAGLATDFNALLAALKTAGLMATS